MLAPRFAVEEMEVFERNFSRAVYQKEDGAKEHHQRFKRLLECCTQMYKDQCHNKINDHNDCGRAYEQTQHVQDSTNIRA